MLSNLLTIFWKDLRENLRDRRNFMRMLFLPGIMIPAMGHFFMAFADNNREKLDEEVLNYAIVGEEYLPELVAAYADQESFKRIDVAEDEVNEALSSKQIHFAIKIPAEAHQQLSEGNNVNVTFVYNQAASGQRVIKQRGTAPLQAFSQRQRDWRLVFLGVSTEEARSDLLNPVTFEEVNVASDREKIGHNLGSIIAYPLFIVCFMGCMFTAVELVAGEKEKGTLEILVMLPIPRYQIVLGKYLVVFCLGLLYATLSMVSLSTWLILEGAAASDIFKTVLLEINTLDIFLVWLMLFPVTALFAAVVLSISIYARSYREASTLTGLANFFVVVAGMMIFMPGVSLNWAWSMVPVSNVGMVIRELIKGTLENHLMILSIFLSTTVIGLALLLFCTAWFRREAIMFRD